MSSILHWAKVSQNLLASWDVLGLKKIEDLSMLIFYPEASSYFWRIFFSTRLSSTLALQKRILSSAKRRWVTLGQPLQMDIIYLGSNLWAIQCVSALKVSMFDTKNWVLTSKFVTLFLLNIENLNIEFIIFNFLNW